MHQSPMSQRLKTLAFSIFFLLLLPIALQAQDDSLPAPLKIGMSIDVSAINSKNMAYAKSAGIDCLQIGCQSWFDNNGHFRFNDEKMENEVKRIKEITDSTGIQVWAIHMPYGKNIDLSLLNEAKRMQVVRLHKEVLTLFRILKPKIILFHPSWFLSLNAREQHIKQLIKSVSELKGDVSDMGATMVIENMTGPELYVISHGIRYERPLCRTVDETIKIMDKLPPDVYAAVDMNHILHPEKLVSALGSRLRFIHVSDGDGAHEYHYYPCSGKGDNDWMVILNALYKAGYSGPFMFECHYKDIGDLAPCYNFLYYKYVLSKYIQPKYKS